MTLCDELGIDLTAGWRRNSETGERHLYGIPVAQLPGIGQYMSVSSGACIGATVYNGNDENTLILLQYLLKALSVAPETAAVTE